MFHLHHLHITEALLPSGVTEPTSPPPEVILVSQSRVQVVAEQHPFTHSSANQGVIAPSSEPQSPLQLTLIFSNLQHVVALCTNNG